jgi:hypothetical protein
MQDILTMAIKAGLPLISASTTDTYNFPAVVKHLTGKIVNPIKITQGKAFNPEEERLYFCIGKKPLESWEELYHKLQAKEATLILLNYDEPTDMVFRAGPVATPKALVAKMLKECDFSEEATAAIMPALGGLTLKEVAEVVRLTQTAFKTITAPTIIATRKAIFPPLKGIQSVDTLMDVYVPDTALAAYAAKEKKFFLDPASPDRLRPKGILAKGPPGTGKTQGAKYLANEWGCPLYRLDLGTVQSKWVGESEEHLRRALAQVDHEEPCILLIDEVEKSVRVSSDSHTVQSNMLAQLLWWMNEHHSRVLVYMTTNNEKVIPPELIREGRIDEHVSFPGLAKAEIVPFAEAVLKSFGITLKSSKHVYDALASVGFEVKQSHTPHAAVTKAVYAYLKANAE